MIKHSFAPMTNRCQRHRRLALTTALACALPLLALAADHNESGDGDLSGDPSNPTVLSVDVGNNVISGQVTDDPLDRDIFTLQVPADTEVVAINLTGFDLLSTPSDGGMLVALEPGGQISDVFSDEALRGFVIAGDAAGTEEGDDLLDDLGGGTLGTGDWTVWVQNTGSVTDYALTVVAADVQPPPAPLPPTTGGPVQNVPALGPLGWLLLVSGMLFLARGAGRRSGKRAG